MARPARYNQIKIGEMIDSIEKYTNETKPYPILKEWCVNNYVDYEYLYQLAEKNPELSEAIKRLLAKKEVELERMSIGKENATAAIFALKQLGWKDRQEFDLPKETLKSIADLIAIYEAKK